MAVFWINGGEQIIRHGNQLNGAEIYDCVHSQVVKRFVADGVNSAHFKRTGNFIPSGKGKGRIGGPSKHFCIKQCSQMKVITQLVSCTEVELGRQRC